MNRAAGSSVDKQSATAGSGAARGGDPGSGAARGGDPGSGAAHGGDPGSGAAHGGDPGSGAAHGGDPGSGGAAHGGDTGNRGAAHGGDPGSRGAAHGGDTGNRGAAHGGDPGNRGAAHGGDPGNRGAAHGGEYPYAFEMRDIAQRNNKFYYSGVGFLMLGMVQFIFFNPLIISGFSMWNRYAYLRGIPWYVCAVLPYAMVIGDLLLAAAGALGIRLSWRKGAARFYKVSGTLAAITSGMLLVLRIVHEHVVFKSVGTVSHAATLPGTVARLQEQYSRSLYIVFVLTAVAAALSFFYIYFSFRFGRPSSFNAGKAMTVTASFGLIVSLCGVVFGGGEGERVPLVAAWAMAAFVSMLAVGIAGFSKRRSPSARTVLGFAHLVVSTFCMLQTIYYAYSATVQGAFFHNVPFIWITALAGVFAASTALSAYYMSYAVFLKKASH